MLANSVLLALGNVVLIALLYLGQWGHIRYGSLENLVGVLPIVVVPFLVLVTLIFAARDLLRPQTRWQAVLALVLSVPIGVLYSLKSF